MIAFVAAVLLMIGGGVVGLRIAVEIFRDKVVKALGPGSEIAALRVGWSTVEVEGLRIRAGRGWPATDALRAEEVIIAPSVRTLLSDQVRVVLFVGETEYTWRGSCATARPAAGRPRTGRKRSLACSAPPAALRPAQGGPLPERGHPVARDCPFNCEFCDIIVMYGRWPRTKSTALFVGDDNFIGNKKEAKELLRTLVAWQETRGYPLEFMTEVSLNVAQDDELLALMKQAHFTTIRVRAGTSRQLEALIRELRESAQTVPAATER